MRRRFVWAAMATVIGAGLTGCASSGQSVDAAADDFSVVAGYIDMADAPSDLRWVSIKGYGTSDRWYRAGVRDGLFFHLGVKPGSYQVDRFGGVRSLIPLFGDPYEYEWGTQGRNRTAVRIDSPGVFFLGSHRYTRQATGFFEAGKFLMQPMSSPTEREVLQRLLRIMESDPSLSVYRHQLARIKQKLGSGQ